MESLGVEITKGRLSKGFTLRAFAKEIGVSASLLSLIEQDKQVPQKELLVLITTKLGLDVDEMFSKIGKITPSAEASFAKVASDDPIYFRQLLSRTRGRK
jgi:transcriptional regulator with XRE-family HTH domain